MKQGSNSRQMPTKRCAFSELPGNFKTFLAREPLGFYNPRSLKFYKKNKKK
jgi:hypothetical protein